MSELGKPFLKKLDRNKKNRKSMSKCRMWTKNHKHEKEIWKKKLVLECTMNGLGKPFRKKIRSKKSKKKH